MESRIGLLRRLVGNAKRRKEYLKNKEPKLSFAQKGELGEIDAERRRIKFFLLLRKLFGS
jgi:hypothetical protein